MSEGGKREGGRRKEEGGRSREEEGGGGRRKEEGGRRTEGGGRREEAGRQEEGGGWREGGGGRREESEDGGRGAPLSLSDRLSERINALGQRFWFEDLEDCHEVSQADEPAWQHFVF
jgi:hypothetical protein